MVTTRGLGQEVEVQEGGKEMNSNSASGPVDASASAGSAGQPVVPVGQLAKAAAADPKTTNLLLLVVVLCMAGMMPDQLTSICGA